MSLALGAVKQLAAIVKVGRNAALQLRPPVAMAILSVFTALHGMQTRSCDENSVRPSVRLSVCPSVRPSVKRVNCDKTAERYV